MAFTVEDATGVAGANSYMTVTEFKAYHAERGNDVTTLNAQGSTAIEKLLVRATDYIEQRFELRFKGQKEFPDTPQGLSFPRVNLYDREGNLITGVPTKLKNAVGEYAWAADSQDLFLTPVQETVGLNPTLVKNKVGPIEQVREYQEGAIPTTIRPIPKADSWLAEYIVPGGRTERA